MTTKLFFSKIETIEVVTANGREQLIDVFRSVVKVFLFCVIIFTQIIVPTRDAAAASCMVSSFYTL